MQCKCKPRPIRSRVAALDHHERALAVLAQLHHSRSKRLLHFHRVRDSSPGFRHADLARDADLDDLSVEALGAGRVVAYHLRALFGSGRDRRRGRGIVYRGDLLCY